MIQSGIAADDGVAIHFVEQEMVHIVSSRPKAKAYHVFLDQTIMEKELTTTFLGST
jgi:dipeptidase E